jgi:hypothetical protein
MATQHLSELPDPVAVAQTLERMRATVLDHYRVWAEQIAAAEELIQEAKVEQARLRESYPMFFAAAVRQTNRVHVGPPVLNKLLRTVSEKPDSTRYQLGSRLAYSPSWIGHLIRVVNSSDHGELIGMAGKRGRRNIYRLTAAGQMFLDNGAFHEEGSS